MDSCGGEDAQQGGGWQTRWSYIHVQINPEEQLRSEVDGAIQGSTTVN